MKSKIPIFCSVVFLFILIALNFWARYLALDDLSELLNYIIVPATFILFYFVFTGVSDIPEKIEKAINGKSGNVGIVYAYQLEGYTSYRVREIDYKTQIIELIVNEKTQLGVYDLLSLCPDITVGNFVKKEGKFLFIINSFEPKTVIHLGPNTSPLLR